uniref:Uncharacterized protein n=1 Tax=Meloidogyne enterolobii TaxID=390850 RepID=A0A6V7XE98_MELEN|nr:unnamed protein product [Meloidogyne enterolobii]
MTNFCFGLKLVFPLIIDAFSLIEYYSMTIKTIKKINDIVSIVTRHRRKNGIHTLRNTICAKIVICISEEITEKIDQNYFGLKLKRFIVFKNF